MKAGKYMTVVVSIDLLNIKVVVYKKLSCKLTNLPFYQDCQIPVVAPIGLLDTSAGEEWSAEVILILGGGEVDTEQAGRVGAQV